VGVVGLGAGALNCYRQAPQAWTYFEIDPAVVRIARASGFFHYLAECGADTKIVLGDARLSLQRLADGSFDLLVIDAFSSDAIPMHLLTREALALYLDKLADGGIILLHISNRYLDLAPIVADLVGNANAVARHQVFVVDPNAPDAADQASCQWVVIARKSEDLAALDGDRRWQPLVPQTGARLWTDDYSNLVGALKPLW
jgi:spermidine synthase